MAYILAKKSTLNGVRRNLYYLVESYREGGKVKRKTIIQLGETNNIDSALEIINRKKEEILQEIQDCREKIKKPVWIGDSGYWPYIKRQERRIKEAEEKLGIVMIELQNMEDIKQTYQM